jgi:hypothetical protein
MALAEFRNTCYESLGPGNENVVVDGQVHLFCVIMTLRN